MKIQYFPDTDTALIDFCDGEIVETKELSENIYIDIDARGNPVSMTIEHAKQSGALSEVSYREAESQSA
ncbi:MAG: DUF2283 domain-containing protein [Spirochaetaceae bacterium]|nr:MAG: DUF2283 domain-containing protein [Spirochaetaceae bacterium]